MDTTLVAEGLANARASVLRARYEAGEGEFSEHLERLGGEIEQFAHYVHDTGNADETAMLDLRTKLEQWCANSSGKVQGYLKEAAATVNSAYEHIKAGQVKTFKISTRSEEAPGLNQGVQAPSFSMEIIRTPEPR